MILKGSTQGVPIKKPSLLNYITEKALFRERK
jgi:hypothetical protein